MVNDTIHQELGIVVLFDNFHLIISIQNIVLQITTMDTLERLFDASKVGKSTELLFSASKVGWNIFELASMSFYCVACEIFILKFFFFIQYFVPSPASKFCLSVLDVYYF